MSVFTKLAFTTAVAASLVAAQTTLYIPGLDPQPIQASKLGVGADGTTWLIAPGTTSGSFSNWEIFGPATVVENAVSAHISYNDPQYSIAVNEACSISGSIAICSAVVGEASVTNTVSQITETVAPMTVQAWVSSATSVAASASSAPSVVAPGSSAPSVVAPKPSAPSVAASGFSRPPLPTPTGDPSSATPSDASLNPSTTQSNTATAMHAPSLAAFAVGAAAGAVYMLL